MKILFVINSLVGGGAEKLTNDLLPLLKERRCQCDLLILSDKDAKYLGALRTSGIAVQVMPDTVRTHVAKIAYIRRQALDQGYDIVHANLFPVIYYCAIAKGVSKGFPRLVMTEHSTDNRRRHIGALRAVEKIMYGAYDSVISNSEQTQRNLLQWIDPPAARRQKFTVVNNGVPIKRFADAIRYARCDLAPDVKATDILLCMTGSFSPRKNHKFMVDVLRILPERYRLLLVGEGKLQQQIREYVKRCGLADRVTFLGFRNDVASIMHSVDIAVIPSKYEGFGLVAVEAMACGIPVVIAGVPGLAEVVGTSALVAEPENVEAFAGKIRSLEDRRTYERYSHEAMEQARWYDIEMMRDRYLRVYDTLQRRNDSHHAEQCRGNIRMAWLTKRFVSARRSGTEQ